jgi:hypothetical protein
MDDYDKKELGRLKDFERVVRDSLCWLGTILQWTYGALLLGVPALVYLSPIKEDRTLQAIILFLVLLFMLGVSKADKALGKVIK